MCLVVEGVTFVPRPLFFAEGRRMDVCLCLRTTVRDFFFDIYKVKYKVKYKVDKYIFFFIVL